MLKAHEHEIQHEEDMYNLLRSIKVAQNEHVEESLDQDGSRMQVTLDDSHTLESSRSLDSEVDEASAASNYRTAGAAEADHSSGVLSSFLRSFFYDPRSNKNSSAKQQVAINDPQYWPKLITNS